ncbi:hypothetical protein EV177_008707 [Coemansia sp. RSA 1804]|nr:hypothetical protein EV177_008707 [Coemansia sp. RSA 1804]
MVRGIAFAATASAAMALILACLTTPVQAHSWVDCVKFDPYSKECLGYARGYPTRNAADINTAYAYLFNASPTSQAMCNPIQQSSASDYSADFPMAVAQPGETIYTSWEANGHLNNTNPTKVQVLYYPDPSHQFSDVSERNTAPVAGTFDYATDQNCYNPDQPNSVCLGSWVVPTNLVPGMVYHFVWFWYFNANPAGQWYSTCFDMQINAASYVVEPAAMDALLVLGGPSPSYSDGLDAAAKQLLTQVTTLSGNYVSGASAAAAASVTPMEAAQPQSTPYATDTAAAAGMDGSQNDVDPAATVAEAADDSSAVSSRKCRPRRRR